jgi:hypothetical protein
MSGDKSDRSSSATTRAPTTRAPGLRDAADPPAFDTGRLELWMAEHIAGFVEPITVDQFAGGQSNPTYLVESPGRRYVLRRKPPGRLLPSAHAVDRELAWRLVQRSF